MQKLKQGATEAFSEVKTLNERIQILEKQHKERDLREKMNLEKFETFSEKFTFVIRMLQKVEHDNK